MVAAGTELRAMRQARQGQEAPAVEPPRATKMAPAKSTLTLWPTTRPVARNPAALPCWPRGAAPISALLFGD